MEPCLVSLSSLQNIDEAAPIENICNPRPFLVSLSHKNMKKKVLQFANRPLRLKKEICSNSQSPSYIFLNRVRSKKPDLHCLDKI